MRTLVLALASLTGTVFAVGTYAIEPTCALFLALALLIGVIVIGTDAVCYRRDV
jgi:NhaP-type Na+/H+ or K+/H+ antiporter